MSKLCYWFVNMAVAVFSKWLNVWAFAIWIPPESFFAELIKELIYIDMESPPQATAGRTEERRRQGLSTTLEFPCVFLLNVELAGWFLSYMFVRGKVFSFRYYYIIKMKAAVKVINRWRSSSWLSTWVALKNTNKHKRLTQILDLLVILIFWLFVHRDVFCAWLKFKFQLY